MSHSEPLTLVCVQCDRLVCAMCLDDTHLDHTVTGLKAAASRVKKEQLVQHQSRLATAQGTLAQLVHRATQEQTHVKDKSAALEKTIRDRHATVTAAADLYRDQALASLTALMAQINTKNADTVTQRQERSQSLQTVQQKMDEAVNSGTDLEVLLAAQNMTQADDLLQAVEKMTSPGNNGVTRPVHVFNVTTDVMLQNVRDYLGSVSSVTREVTEPEMRVVEQFRCGTETDIEVFSLCHVDGAQPFVKVSYEWCGLKEDVPVKYFGEKGECLYVDDKKGKVSYRQCAEGKSMSPALKEGSLFTFSKSLTAGHFRLSNDLSGTARIVRVTVTSTEPFKADHTTAFSINVGAHRAFDVDTSERFFAVVEEASPPDHCRKLRLYQRPDPHPVSTYSPPTPCPSLQPSDICFYQLQGREYLLVADELGDALHVLHVEQGQMKWVRCLALACPSLTQPTALTVDMQGRLWVAGRGGNVFCLQPIA